MSDELKKKAESGDMQAQCQLALVFELGLTGATDYAKAYEWWQKAANQGSPWALKKVAGLIETGKVKVENPEAEAQKWHDLAKKAGYRDAGDILESSVKKPPRRGPGALNKKVLIVDDQDDLRRVMQVALVADGFTVVAAKNGKEALKKLGENPDLELIFVDLNMPVMNGFQFIQTLRQLRAAEGVPIAIVSAIAKPEYISKGRQLGVQAWIMKPFGAEKISATADELLGLQSA